jgi:hypothetical protein
MRSDSLGNNRSGGENKVNFARVNHVLREKVRRRERNIHLCILMSCLYKNLTIRKDYGVPSFVNEFWRFYSSHLQLLLFSCFFFSLFSMSCCSFISCICCGLFNLMASVHKLCCYVFVCLFYIKHRCK